MKVAVIGTGGWGLQHARVFSQHPKVEFCAVVGRNAERAEARAKQFHTKAYTDIDQMLTTERPDLVSLCLPNQGHYEPTMQVIRAGFPLIVEKPLVFELDEAHALLEAAGDRFFAICFNHRWSKPVRMAKEAIETGKVGEIVFASWRFGGEGSSDHPYANLIETQCHGFDMLEHLCGPIEALSAEMTAHPSTMALSLKFRSGAVGSLLGSYDTSYAYPETQRIEVSGSKGRFVIDDTVARYRFNKAGSETGEIWEAGYFNDYDREFHRTFDSYMDAVVEAFLDGQAPPIHARAGLRALELAHAAIRSSESGARVTV
ncbi:MAG: Gfo/Idh/MocA family oxidoreductase [Armatimonadetes bacterium]|nr:Gfo/Idh/MocA family oxidoreductase [Armatimonadota bacterium]